MSARRRGSIAYGARLVELIEGELPVPGREPRVGAREESGGARVVVDAQARRAAKPCAVVASAPRRSALRATSSSPRATASSGPSAAAARCHVAPLDVARTFERGRERAVHLALFVR